MRSPKRYLVVEALPDGGVQMHGMKEWCRRHPSETPTGMHPDVENSQTLLRGFRRLGWSVNVTDTEVQIMRPGSAAAVDDVIGSDDMASDDANDNSDAGDVAFELERQLQEFIAHNISSIRVDGKKLQLYEDSASKGLEYQTAIGRIDILAVDEDNAFVVFELKRGQASDYAIGQIARYMGWVKQHLAKGRLVRGVIVARSISESLRYAIAAVQDVSLFEYQLKFDLRPVAEAAPVTD